MSPAGNRPPRFALLIGTGLGLGYLPKAPGTWGSLGGAGLVMLIRNGVFLPFMALAERYGRLEMPFLWMNPLLLLQITLAAGTAVVGVWAAGRVARHLGTKDPQSVVIDEICGQQIAFLPLGMPLWRAPSFEGLPNWKYFLVGFILFRVFDIWKPWPARQAEKLPGGWGIMADDWVAGIYAAVGLWAARALGL